MPKYLIRRRNRFGQWEHIETLEYEPYFDLIRARYGPGVYNVMIAEEHIRGLQHFADFTVPYQLEYVDWKPEKPDGTYIFEHYGEGNYFIVGQGSDITPITVTSPYTQPPQGIHYVEDIMLQGIPVMKNVYVIFRLTGLPYY